MWCGVRDGSTVGQSETTASGSRFGLTKLWQIVSNHLLLHFYLQAEVRVGGFASYAKITWLDFGTVPLEMEYKGRCFLVCFASGNKMSGSNLIVEAT